MSLSKYDTQTLIDEIRDTKNFIKSLLDTIDQPQAIAHCRETASPVGDLARAGDNYSRNSFADITAQVSENETHLENLRQELRRRHPWTRESEALAIKGGWNVFAVDGDPCRLEIQRVDDAETFTCDQEAVEYVKNWAQAGSPVCKLALLQVI